MSVFDSRIEWKRTNDKETIIPITDAITISINKSTEIKNNLCQINLKNSPVSFASDGTTKIGEYVEVDTKLIKFNEEDELKIWADYLTDATEVGTQWYDDARLFGSFVVREFNIQTDESQTRINLKAVDSAYLLFNSIYTFNYGVSNLFTSPGIIRHCSRKFGESNQNTVTSLPGTHNDVGTQYAINAKFVSEGGYIEDYRRIRTSTNPDTYSVDVSTQLNGSITNSSTTITVDSTSGFESSGTLVIGDEHIAYTGVTSTTFTGCTRGIDDTTAQSHSDNDVVYQGFPLILMSKIWKPLFEWIGELCQTENTNYLSETQEGGTLYFNRAFLFWIDKDNSPHFVYPDDTVDLTIDLGEEGRRAFNLDKAVFDAINFIIYNSGEDMYGNGIIHYWYDDTSDVSGFKMRFQPMSQITFTLIQEDLLVNTSRSSSNDNDKYKQFPSSYPVTPSFLDDSNKFRALLGQSARANVTSDSEYNDALREAAKQRGYIEAQKITKNKAGLRYRGQIAIKGTHVNPGDLIQLNNNYVGLLSQKLRVINVTHSINQNNWETTLEVEEDEKSS